MKIKNRNIMKEVRANCYVEVLCTCPNCDYGFDLTACELDKEYFDKAMERIKNHTNQQKLF